MLEGFTEYYCSPPAETLLEIIAFNKILPKSWELNVKRRAAATSFVAKIGDGQIIIMSLTLKSSEFNIASPTFFCPLYCCHLAFKAAVQFCEQFGFQRGLDSTLWTLLWTLWTPLWTLWTLWRLWIGLDSTVGPLTGGANSGSLSLCAPPELDTVSLLFTRRALSGNQIICLCRQAVLYVI